MSLYPTYFLRGLRSKAFLIEGTMVVAGAAFEPDYRTNEQRNDKGFETSINWEDDATVLPFTLRNQQTAAHGDARVMRPVLDDANSLQNLRPYFYFGTLENDYRIVILRAVVCPKNPTYSSKFLASHSGFFA